jgi:hypothetical protein
MARRGILDYVLGGAVGGLEGLAQQRAAEDEKKRMADAANRQAMLDALALGDRGFTESGVRQERTKAATPAIGAMLNTAMSMGRGAAPSGVLPDLSAVEQAAGMYGKPVQSFQVGGKTYEKTLTKPQEEAMAFSREEESKGRQLQQAERVKAAEATRVAEAKKSERESQIQAYMGAGYSRKDATMLADNASAFTAMRGQDISAATARQNQARSDSRADRDYKLRKKEFERKEADSVLRREKLPVSAQGKLAGLDAGVLMVGDVSSMLNQHMNAIGPIKGRMFRSILDANDKEGVGTRAAIENLSGEIRNQRFGGALTATEVRSALAMLPDEKDEAVNALTKLAQLEDFLERKREGIFRVYKQPYERVNATAAPSPKASPIKEW